MVIYKRLTIINTIYYIGLELHVHTCTCIYDICYLTYMLNVHYPYWIKIWTIGILNSHAAMFDT